jgi:hypothetical protein
LILDLGNTVPTNATPPASGPTVPDAGWPINNATFQVTIPGPSVGLPRSYGALKSGGAQTAAPGEPSELGSVNFTLDTYLTYAGIVEIPVSGSLAGLLQSQPISLKDTTNNAPAAQEDSQGRYVDVDVPFFRLNPGDSAPVTLWATKFGLPWAGASLDVALVPQVGAPTQPPSPQSQNGGPWANAYPQSALTLSTNAVVTVTAGTGVLTLTAGDPGTPRTYPDGEPGPDGQVYWVTGSWANWGLIFLFPGTGIINPPSGTPINVLVFSGYTAPAQPNWNDDVEPILGNYARMYPYMKTIIDLGDYNTVTDKANAQAIQYVLNLPPTDPHHMPIVRDLSQAKLAMIKAWFKSGAPLSSSSSTSSASSSTT